MISTVAKIVFAVAVMLPSSDGVLVEQLDMCANHNRVAVEICCTDVVVTEQHEFTGANDFTITVLYYTCEDA